MQSSNGGKERTIQQTPAHRSRKAKLECVSHDMTESQKTQDEPKQLYRAVMANAYFGMALIDANYKILTVNTAVSTYFRKPVRELIGRKCYQEFEKGRSICPYCPGTRAMATGKPAEVETEGVRDDGTAKTGTIRRSSGFLKAQCSCR